MNNQTLLEIQLDRLQKVSHDIERDVEDRFVNLIKLKRAELVYRMYSDLADEEQYRKAIGFLADDLLGGNQLGQRGHELLKAKKPMVKILPDALIGTVARSVEFTAITLQIDIALAKYVAKTGFADAALTDETYIHAARSAVPREWLDTQTGLVVKVGEEIESVVRRPFVASALRMCRTPAYMMGLGGLQDFLERGFEAFRAMRNPGRFIEVFSERESIIVNDIYTGGSTTFSAG